tara:strand:+ start:2913 stop:5603 length:2691 start_codon:yes stop_codon:yes gene_type:complete
VSDTATWGGLKLELPPPVLEPIITAINTFLELVIVILDITLVVLDIVKVFIVGLLSPLLAVIDAIIALFESLANDLRKAGFYARFDKFNADGKTFEQHMATKKGGFEAFESRCFNWLIDSSDPKRPDFSTASGTLGLVFYGSVDFEEFMKLIRMIQSLMRLFGGDPYTPLAQPTKLKCDMKLFGGGPFGVSKVGFSKMWDTESATLPSIAGLTWGHAASPHSPLGLALPPRPPDCSIIEISTTPEGFFAGATRNAAGPTDPKRIKSEFIEAPLGIGGGPLKIYGGTQTLVKSGSMHNGVPLNDPGTDGGLWFVKDKNDAEPIYLKQWVEAEKAKGAAIGQSQIVIHHGSVMNMFFPNFEYDLEYESCPYPIKKVVGGKPEPESERAREVYVRISSGNEGCAELSANKDLTANDSDASTGYRIENLINSADPLRAYCFPKAAKRSKPSQMLKVRFPSESQRIFTQMIRNAACIAYLCRGGIDDAFDDPENKPTHPSGFLPLYKKLAIYMDGGELAYNDTAAGWGSRKKIATAARRIADDFTTIAGFIPDSVFDSLVEAHAHNLNFLMSMRLGPGTASNKTDSIIPSFSDQIQDATGITFSSWKLDDGLEDLYTHCSKREGGIGFHMNFPCFTGDNVDLYRSAVTETGLGMDPQFTPSTSGSKFTVAQAGMFLDAVPIVTAYAKMENLDDTKNWDSDEWVKQMDELGKVILLPARIVFTTDQLRSALAIMNIATNLSGDAKGWVAFTPFDGFLEPVEEFFEKIVNWLKIFREGILAVIKQILDYIRMIEARILELQQLIRKIQAILSMFADFVVSADLHMLVVSGAGTQGLISEFMTAEEKPSDGPDAYGMGGIVVTGGLPLIILDIIKACFQATEDKPSGGAAGGPSATDLLEDTGA